MTVKATAGKGNLKKEGMIDTFIQHNNEELQSSGFWKAIHDNPSQFQTKKGVWLKPIDDVVDSYWVLRTLQKTLETL